MQMMETIAPTTADQSVVWSVIPGTGTATISATGLVAALTNGTVWAKAISISNSALQDSVQVSISNQLVPATSVTVNTQGNVPPVIAVNAGTLQMNATILPVTANQSVTWFIVPSSGNAIISTTGLISATGNGMVWSKAISVSNPALKDAMLVTISGHSFLQTASM